MDSHDECADLVAEAAGQRDESRARSKPAPAPAFWTWEQISAFARHGRAHGDLRPDPHPESVRAVVECERMAAGGCMPFIDIPRGGAPRVCGQDVGMEAVRAKTRAARSVRALGCLAEACGADKSRPWRGDGLAGHLPSETWQAFNPSVDVMQSHGAQTLLKLPDGRAARGNSDRASRPARSGRVWH